MNQLSANFYRRYPQYCKVLQLSVEELKKLWDSYDGITTSNQEYSVEDVHMALNVLGYVDYCRV